MPVLEEIQGDLLHRGGVGEYRLKVRQMNRLAVDYGFLLLLRDGSGIGLRPSRSNTQVGKARLRL
ncbi:MAG: hypothetical protein ABSF64_10095 [Bryobacteraceae bacterium]|jgi:hypothetical protein